MPNLIQRNMILADNPFDGNGVSLYADAGETIHYRRPAVMNGRLIPSGSSKLRQNPIPRTERVAFVLAPETEIPYTIPEGWADETVTLQVRTFRDGVENEAIDGTKTFALDGSGVPVTDITGTAVLLSTRKMDGGVVEIRFQWYEGSGLPADTFQLIRTAGPTSPSNIVFDASGSGVYAVETAALSDASAYTFKIRAVNGSTTKDVLTGISVTADATGPSAPTSGSAEAW